MSLGGRYDPSGNEPVRMGAATVQVVTAKAVLVRSSRGIEHWIPFSGVHDDSEIFGKDEQGYTQRRGETGTLIVKRWFARSKGWTTE